MCIHLHTHFLALKPLESNVDEMSTPEWLEERTFLGHTSFFNPLQAAASWGCHVPRCVPHPRQVRQGLQPLWETMREVFLGVFLQSMEVLP